MKTIEKMKSLTSYRAVLMSVFIMLGGCAKSGSNNSPSLDPSPDSRILSSTGVVRAAASCNASDVQNAINSASEGDTVTIPAGTCTWTAGVTISGKGVDVIGAGSARIIARDNGSDLHSVATGALTLNIKYYSPGFSASSISAGQTLLVFQLGAPANFMQGTVTSINKSTNALVMNVTETGGSATGVHRWEITTVVPTSTVIINSSTSTALFDVTEDTSFHTSIGNLQVIPGAIQQRIVTLNYTTGGQAILLHDMWLRGDAIDLPHGMNSDSTMIEGNTTRGVAWNISFESAKFDISTMAGITIKDTTGVTGAWTSPSYWGATDTTGQNNFYCESNDFHGMAASCDTDDNGRMVDRYNLLDNAGVMTHGADTSHYGQRYLEIYNNTFIKDSYGDHTTFNLPQFFYVRGGSFVLHDNIMPLSSGSDYGTMTNVNLTVMNLQRDSGPNPCWGANPTSAGQFHYAPRQVGIGRVTGTGKTTYTPDGVTNGSIDSYGIYVGDPEPAYIWNNNGSSSALSEIHTSDYGININPSGCAHDGVPSAMSTYDISANYIVPGKDYFNDGTAKPGYTPYIYPHPLATGTAPAPTPTPSSSPTPNPTPKPTPSPTPVVGAPNPPTNLRVVSFSMIFDVITKEIVASYNAIFKGVL